MQDEIRELNLTYLLLARRMLHEDRELAMLQMQLDDDMANFLLSLPSSKLMRLAQTNQFLFQLRINEYERLKKLTHNERDQGMSQIHTAVLLASSGDAVAA